MDRVGHEDLQRPTLEFDGEQALRRGQIAAGVERVGEFQPTREEPFDSRRGRFQFRHEHGPLRGELVRRFGDLGTAFVPPEFDDLGAAGADAGLVLEHLVGFFDFQGFLGDQFGHPTFEDVGGSERRVPLLDAFDDQAFDMVGQGDPFGGDRLLDQFQALITPGFFAGGIGVFLDEFGVGGASAPSAAHGAGQRRHRRLETRRRRGVGHGHGKASRRSLHRVEISIWEFNH